MPKKAKPRKLVHSALKGGGAPAAGAEQAKPSQFHIAGNPWSLIFAPLPRFLDQQGVWLFNEKDGELWELVANNNFVLRPRQGS